MSTKIMRADCVLGPGIVVMVLVYKKGAAIFKFYIPIPIQGVAANQADIAISADIACKIRGH